MENQALAGACVDQKSRELKTCSQGQPAALFSQCAKSNRPNRQFDLPQHPCFKQFGRVLKNKIGSRYTCRRVAKRTGLGNARYQVNTVHKTLGLHTTGLTVLAFLTLWTITTVLTLWTVRCGVFGLLRFTGFFTFDIAHHQ